MIKKDFKIYGFTLIELITAIFVFSLLFVSVSGRFANILEIQRRVFNSKKIEENGRFILETMAREIRVANSINGPDNECPNSFSSSLTFIHPINGTIRYFLADNSVHREINGIDTIISNPDIKISNLNFCISGTSPDDKKQTRITIILSLKAGEKTKQEQKIDLQTTISKRLLVD